MVSATNLCTLLAHVSIFICPSNLRIPKIYVDANNWNIKALDINMLETLKSRWLKEE